MLYESNYYGAVDLGNVLEHHGIKGQKWGIRRFQYEDGVLTPAGRARYDVGPRERKSTSSVGSKARQERTVRAKALAGMTTVSSSNSAKKSKKTLSAKESEERKAQRKELAKRIAKGVAIGAAVAGTAIAAKKLKDLHIEKEKLREQLRQADLDATRKIGTYNYDYERFSKLTPLAGRDISKLSRRELKNTLKRTDDLNAALLYKQMDTIDSVTHTPKELSELMMRRQSAKAADLKKNNKDLLNKSIDYLKDLDDIDEYFTGRRKRR